ncbi:MAG TPA: carboxypeptidase-like regulatory domain-containing protein, partial [Vicinamibacteria bacterium]|nr:carboxypeptidase-like regulatory domain-containing protein [Vicinamibacteria bacterium]
MPIRQRLLFTSALLVVLGLSGPSAWAQYSSTLEGTVSDQSGAVVPGATVSTTNEATGVSQHVLTTSAGYYRFPALAGGVYTLKVSLTGFKNWTRNSVRLESTQTRAVNVTLEVGSATAEEVNVTAEAPLVETSQARVSRLIEEQQIKELPLV